ncbi:MAG: hypothetical protein FGM61_06720 [Sediminibacterium sp.]|nr:hypothetical protein [Sediminibacterium sp.]
MLNLSQQSFLERKRSFSEWLDPDSSLYDGRSKQTNLERAEMLFNAAPAILPDRYSWHLSYPLYRSRIAQQGILPICESKPLVFANNQIEFPYLLWPIVFDDSGMMFDWEKYPSRQEAEKALTELVYGGLDYWRIDAEIAGYHGYRIDPFQPALIADMFYTNAREEHYICRRESIPPQALKLFRFNANHFETYLAYLRGNISLLVCQENEGAVSVGGFDKANPYFLTEVKPEDYCFSIHSIKKYDYEQSYFKIA